MRDETTRRRAEDRPREPVAEAGAGGPTLDEDAAALIRDAAEAAAAAALDAQALAAEIEADAAAREDEGAHDAAPDPSAEGAAPDLEAEERVAVPDERAADGRAEAAADPAHDGTADAGLAADDGATAGADGRTDAQVGDASILPAGDFVSDGRGAAAAPADRTGADVDATWLDALSEASPTAEEEALAQAAADDEDDVAPAEIAEPEPDEELQGSFEKIAAKARRLDDDQARHVIHSILFVADKPLSVEQLRAATGLEPARVRAALERLAGELREGISGVVLSEVAGGWQLRTAPESAEFVRRFLQVKPRRLTRAALETLAIIAYRQPVTRPEIEDIRGVDSGAVVKALLDWKLIKILGKKDEVGRPLLYGTSREFLEFFQLKDLASLPTLREFHELTEESVQIVEEELGPEAAAGIAGTVAELTDPSYLEAEKERAAKSEQALAELEQALADAEAKAASVAQTIDPKKAEEPPPEAGT